MIEEVGEIAHELTRNRLQDPQMVDAIGDTMVTLIIFADIVGVDLRSALELAYNEIAPRKGETIGGAFIKEKQ